MVELISGYFIPLAVDTNVLNQYKKDLGWEMDVTPVWGFHIVTPEGKKVANTTCYGTAWGNKNGPPAVYGPKDLAGFLKPIIADSGNLKPRKVKPQPLQTDRGAGLNGDGVARLAVHVRPAGQYGLVKHDSIYLGAEQRKSAAPPQAKVGARYTLPEDFAREFASLVVFDSCGGCLLFPKDLTQAKIEAEVTAVSEERIEVVLKGEIAGKGGRTTYAEGAGRIEGLIVFNRKGEMQELLVIYEGIYKGGHKGGEGLPTQGVVDWRAAPESKQESPGTKKE